MTPARFLAQLLRACAYTVTRAVWDSLGHECPTCGGSVSYRLFDPHCMACHVSIYAAQSKARYEAERAAAHRERTKAARRIAHRRRISC